MGRGCTKGASRMRPPLCASQTVFSFFYPALCQGHGEWAACSFWKVKCPCSGPMSQKLTWALEHTRGLHCGLWLPGHLW